MSHHAAVEKYGCSLWVLGEFLVGMGRIFTWNDEAGLNLFRNSLIVLQQKRGLL